MDEVINLEHVYKKIGQREILRNVTLEVNKGDIFGYLGPNGAGKTTSIRIMLGLFTATSGKVSVLGRDVRDDKVREKIGFVLEIDGLYENMTAFDNLAYFAQLYNIDQPAEKIKRALSLVGLSDRVQDKAGTYSKGMRQRLALARAVLHDPAVLILDEPTAGVDPTGQIEIRRIMLDMVNKEGKTILLSSHNLDEVQRICNRIALINKGQIRLYGELEKLQHEMGHGEIVIETTEPIASNIIAELKSLPEVNILEQRDKLLTLSAGKNVEVPNIITFLASRGVKLEQFKKQEASLEEIYTSIMKEAERR